MPYADKDRQREFQRLWAKNKKHKYGFDRRTGRRVYENIDGTMNLTKKIITWAELTKEDLSKISTWDECVKKAKQYVSGRRINRIAIAALAMRSCEIKQGGDRRTMDYKNDNSKKTVVSFANRIGIHHKTLFGWIEVKRKIVDSLLEQQKTIDYSAARNAVIEMKKHGISAQEAYKRCSNLDPFNERAMVLCKYLNNAASILNNFGIKYFPDDKVQEARIAVKSISRNLKCL